MSATTNRMNKVLITDQQGRPLEGVVIMVSSGPVSVPDMASITDSNGVGSLGQLSTQGPYTLNLHYNQQQVDRQIQFESGQSITISL